MTESHAFEIPAWVRRADGRVVPFEPDKICQAIFLAGESLQQPNAFLARELTDGVLHFLGQEHGTGTPTTGQIADLIVKVLPELGQPTLALAFAQRRTMNGDEQGRSGEKSAAKFPSVTVSLQADKTPEQFVDECRRLFSLHGVFSRDLRAAQEEGFLSLAGLEHPAELAGGVLTWPGPHKGLSLLAAILEARRRFGGFIVLDSPDYAFETQTGVGHIGSWVEQLKQALEATGLRAIVNLNVAEPPPWARQSAQGPLFQSINDLPTLAGAGSEGDAGSLALLANLLEQFATTELVRIDWHLGTRDFQKSDTGLTLALQAACRGWPISFVLDRNGSPPALAEGADRRHSDVLQAAGLHLNRLADMSGADGDVQHFLARLVHLAQMALSAGVQKRRFLKQLSERPGSQAADLGRGFLLDRARLCVVPVGLPAVVQRFTGQAITGRQGIALAKEIVERLGQCLLQAGRAVNMDAVLDSPWWTQPRTGSSALFSQPHLTGLTSADFAGSGEDQLRAAGVLHQLAGSGTATLLLPADLGGNVERLRQLLHFAWKKTGVVRVRLARTVGDERFIV